MDTDGIPYFSRVGTSGAAAGKSSPELQPESRVFGLKPRTTLRPASPLHCVAHCAGSVKNAGECAALQTIRAVRGLLFRNPRGIAFRSGLMMSECVPKLRFQS